MSQDRQTADHPVGGCSVFVRWSPKSVLVGVQGELDLASAAQLHRRLVEVLDAEGTQVMLDLSEVAFVDCSGWRPIADTAALLAQRDAYLEVIGASSQVHRLVELIGLEPGLRLMVDPEASDSMPPRPAV